MKQYNSNPEKYYLSKKHTQYFEKYLKPVTSENENCGHGEGGCIEIGNLHYYNYDEMNRVYSVEGVSPTLRTMQGGNRQPKILIE